MRCIHLEASLDEGTGIQPLTHVASKWMSVLVTVVVWSVGCIANVHMPWCMFLCVRIWKGMWQAFFPPVWQELAVCSCPRHLTELLSFESNVTSDKEMGSSFILYSFLNTEWAPGPPPPLLSLPVSGVSRANISDGFLPHQCSRKWIWTQPGSAWEAFCSSVLNMTRNAYGSTCHKICVPKLSCH